MKTNKKRTIVSIDGFNFFYGSLKGTSYKWLNIESMFKDLLSDQNDIVQINYYTARVNPSGNDSKVHERQNAYLRALQSYCPLVNITFGHFLRNPVTLENYNPPPQSCRVWKNEEKGSDVNLAVHMVNDGWMDKLDVAVVVSNDSDLAESLRILKTQLGKTIGLCTPGAPKRRTSGKLAEYADFFVPIRNTALAQHQLPNSIPHTQIIKPLGW